MKVRSLRIEDVNLVISDRGVSSVLACIVLKSLIGRKPVDFFWLSHGMCRLEEMTTLLGRKTRETVCVGFSPDDGQDVAALVSMIVADAHRIGGICDVHGRSAWLRRTGTFAQLFLQPQNADNYFSCPGRVLLNAFADQFEAYERELCELSHHAAQGELRDFAQTISWIASEDPSMDGRRTNLVNHFAFDRNPSPQISNWIQEARQRETA